MTNQTSISTSVPAMEPWLRDILRCPVTGSELRDGTDAVGQPTLESSAVSPEHGGRLAYPIRDGIPVLLAGEATVVAE